MAKRPRGIVTKQASEKTTKRKQKEGEVKKKLVSKESVKESEDQEAHADDVLLEGEEESDGEADDVIEPPKKKAKEEPGFKVFVGTVPWSQEETKGIREFFTSCGEISKLEVPNKMAFVTFKDEAGLNKALELNGKEFGGQQLKVKRAIEKDEATGTKVRGMRGRGRGSGSREGRAGTLAKREQDGRGKGKGKDREQDDKGKSKGKDKGKSKGNSKGKDKGKGKEKDKGKDKGKGKGKGKGRKGDKKRRSEDSGDEYV